jgi:hypothetical protein
LLFWPPDVCAVLAARMTSRKRYRQRRVKSRAAVALTIRNPLCLSA